jgi:S-formylglutathione hydrolase FrmB
LVLPELPAGAERQLASGVVEPWARELRGRLEETVFESEALRGNPLGDPDRRPLWVYLPPGYDDEPGRRYPSVYMIQGLTGQLDMWRNRAPFRRNFPELADELFASEGAPPAIVVWVDCWTSLGGSQFLDSPGTGRYHTYLCDEVVPWVDARYRTLAAPKHRGIAGKSSGGYGAMVTPMLRPDLFGGLATHAGDALFEACYLPEFREAARALRDDYDGSFDRFWEDFRSRPAFSKESDHFLLNTWCMAACYSADEDGTVRLPFDPATAQLVPEVWERWLAWDPVRMVPRYADAIRSLRAIYVDAGTRDEFFLDLGAEAFRRALADVGVEDVHFELFDATHMAIEYRYPLGLRYLVERLRPVE